MVYGLTDLQFWAFALAMPLVWGVTFFLPGAFVIRRFQVKSLNIFLLLSLVTGLAMWGIQAYIFGYLHLRWLSYAYLIFFLIQSQHHFKLNLKIRQIWLHIYKPALLLIGLGTLLQVLAVIGSGLRFPAGVKFFFSNETDGVMHLAYIDSMMRTFPPQEPAAAGLMLNNYHYWSDLVIADLARVWNLPVAHLFFQFMPVLIALLTGIAMYLVIRVWKGSRITGLWGLFWLYFSADAAYVFTLALYRQLRFNTPAIDNGITQFLNIPHTFAKLIFLTSLIPLTYWLHTKKIKWLALTIALFTTLAGFKIYFAIFAVIGLSLVVATQILGTFWQTRQSLMQRISQVWQRHRWTILLMMVYALGSALIYFPANRSAGGLFYSPLEWPKIFLGPDGINYQDWWLRHQVYEQYHNTRNLIILDSAAIVICLVSVYGTRLLGFLRNRRMTQIIGWELYLFFFPGILLFTWLGLYTLQQSGLFNVFNFFAVAAVGLSLFSAFSINDFWQSHKIWWKGLVIGIVLFTLPRSLFELTAIWRAYTYDRFNEIISPTEVAALKYVADTAPLDTVIQADITNKQNIKTPYISFFAQKSSFLAGDGLLASHNQPVGDRHIILKEIFQTANPMELAAQLKKQNIQLLYLRKKEDGSTWKILDQPNQAFSIFYQNEAIKILEIR